MLCRQNNKNNKAYLKIGTLDHTPDDVHAVLSAVEECPMLGASNFKVRTEIYPDSCAYAHGAKVSTAAVARARGHAAWRTRERNDMVEA